jgi:AsmA family protein
MKALRVGKWLTILVVALVVAGIAIVLSTDLGAYKSYAEGAVEDATGRKLAIDGAVKLELFPAPSLVAEKVRFANAPWGSRPDMATVARIEARVALWPLISGDIVVTKLALDRPDILIETDKEGRGNWELGGARSAPQPDSSGAAIRVVDDVTVTHAKVTYRNGRTGASDTLALASLHVEGSGPGAPLDVALHGAANGQPLVVTGRVVPSESKGWTVSNLAAALGATKIAGSVTIEPGASPPRLTAKLDSPEIDLAALVPAGPADATPTQGDGRAIPDVPLPLDALGTVDADVTLTAKRIVSGKLALDDVTVRAVVKGGTLAIRPLSASLAGGVVTGEVTLSGDDTAKLQIAAKDIATASLLAAFGKPDTLASKAALDARLEGRGRTLRQLAASLDGTFAVMLGEGTIGSGYVDLLGADVIRTLLPSGGGGDTTRLNCIAAPFMVEKGIAKTDAILFDTAGMTVRGGGTVNLGDETIDLLLKPAPKDAALVSFATPLRVSGTLANPTAYPDPAGVVKGVASAVAGAALGPIGLLLPLISGGTQEGNACLAALRKDDGKSSPAPMSEKSSGPAGVLEDIGSGIERGFKGLFGR